MAQAFSKAKLSGSTDGKGIKVGATSTPGTTIHTAVSGTTNFDEVWLYAINTSTTDVVLTLEYGSASAPDDNIIQTIVAKGGLLLILPGLILQNSAVIKAFAATTNVVVLHGFVNQIR
jgi:hypothetical protein